MFAAGTVVGGRYRLIQEIGQGGMATVWEAEHLTLKSPVAVKFVIAAGPRLEQLFERFMHEARVAASVRHRNVIEITDFGITEAERAPYMVMELLTGESLADRFDRERRLPVGTAAHIVWLSLRGLAAVHDAGIVHRDLKPENIFLVADPDGAYPKLLDFGVSRRMEDTGTTHDNMLVGTPDYMSPEQARGLRDLDARTDLYSMGVILYEALAGRLPFVCENAGDLLMMITKDPPPPIQSFRSDVSDQLAEVVMRALAKDREARFHDAREMRWALASAATEYGLSPERESGVSRISEFPMSEDAPGRAARDSSEQRARSGRTSELDITEAEIVTPKAPSGPPSVAPAAGGRGTRVVVLLALLAAAVGVTAALFAPEAPTIGWVLGEEDASPGTPWRPASTAWPPFLSPDAGVPDATEVRVYLHQLPDGSVATIEGREIEGDEVWLPLENATYHVDVVRGQTELWRVVHPGDVDGEYEVWPMTEAELAATDDEAL